MQESQPIVIFPHFLPKHLIRLFNIQSKFKKLALQTHQHTHDIHFTSNHKFFKLNLFLVTEQTMRHVGLEFQPIDFVVQSVNKLPVQLNTSTLLIGLPLLFYYLEVFNHQPYLHIRILAIVFVYIDDNQLIGFLHFWE